MGDKFTWDDEVRGLGRRERNGRASWIVQFRVGHKQRRKKLGENLSKGQARKLARKYLAKVELGEDPVEVEQQNRKDAKFTLKALAADYLEVKRGTVRKRTYRELVRYLDGLWKPLHGEPINAIARREVAHELGKITKRNGATTADRARSALSGLYVWAMGEGLAEQNPVVGTNRPAQPKARERVLCDEELAAVWRVSGDDAYGKVIKLLILTGARRAEVGGMRRSEIDTERGVWSLPGERTKNGHPHIVPLSPLVMEIIESVPHQFGRDQLFGSRSADGLAHWHAKADLDRRLGRSVKPWRVHDLRRTAATRMADLGIAPHVIEAVLNHYSGHRSGVAGIYNRSSYDREKVAALALWADHVRTLVEGGERKIVPMRQVP